MIQHAKEMQKKDVEHTNQMEKFLYLNICSMQGMFLMLENDDNSNMMSLWLGENDMQK